METIFGIFATLAVITGVFALVVVGAIIAGLAWGVRRAVYAIKGEEYRPLLGDKTQHEYEHQDVDAGATADSIRNVLRRYTRAVVVGKRAQAGIAALDNAKRKAAAFRAVLDKKFQPNSLSWEKFAVAANMTEDAILRNCASLANRVQVFDRAGYQGARKQELGHRSSTWRVQQGGRVEAAIIDPAAAEKQRVLQAGLDEMDALLASNDRLLTELDKLTFELGKLTDADSTADGDRIVEEIRTLIDETKYYGQAASNG